MAANVQVYRDPAEDAWSVKVTGEKETDTLRYSSKEEAVEEARRLADKRGLELIVHEEGGRTEAKESSE